MQDKVNAVVIITVADYCMPKRTETTLPVPTRHGHVVLHGLGCIEPPLLSSRKWHHEASTITGTSAIGPKLLHCEPVCTMCIACLVHVHILSYSCVSYMVASNIQQWKISQSYSCPNKCQFWTNCSWNRSNTTSWAVLCRVSWHMSYWSTSKH